MIDISQESEQD